MDICTLRRIAINCIVFARMMAPWCFYQRRIANSQKWRTSNIAATTLVSSGILCIMSSVACRSYVWEHSTRYVSGMSCKPVLVRGGSIGPYDRNSLQANHCIVCANGTFWDDSTALYEKVCVSFQIPIVFLGQKSLWNVWRTNSFGRHTSFQGLVSVYNKNRIKKKIAKLTFTY